MDFLYEINALVVVYKKNLILWNHSLIYGQKKNASAVLSLMTAVNMTNTIFLFLLKAIKLCENCIGKYYSIYRYCLFEQVWWCNPSFGTWDQKLNQWLGAKLPEADIIYQKDGPDLVAEIRTMSGVACQLVITHLYKCQAI